MLTFLTGVDTAGKRKYISEKISSLLDDGVRVFLIVPEQSSFDRDREFLFAYGERKSNRLTVTSFTHFAEDILEASGSGIKPRSDDNARAVLMSLAVRENADALEIYRRFAGRAECVSQLLGTYDEIKQAGLGCAELAGIGSGLSGNLQRKVRELSVVFAAFEGLLTERFSDPADNLKNAAAVLSQTDAYADAVFFFDGFRGFTGAQIRFLSLLAAGCRECYVSVTAPSLIHNDHNEAFTHALRNAENVRFAAARAGVRAVEYAVDLPDAPRDAVNTLRHSLFAADGDVFEGDTADISVIRAADPYEECELAALMIRRLLDSGLRCRDIAVFERGGGYADKLIPVLKKYGIPVFEDKRRPFYEYPLVRLILSAVEIAANGFETEKVLACLRTGLCGVEPDDGAALESYVYCWGIDHGGWGNTFTENPDGFGSAFTEDGAAELAALNISREKLIKPLSKLRAQLKKCDSENSCRAVYSYLREVDASGHFLEYARFLHENGDEEGAVECGRVWDECMSSLDSLNGALNGRKVAPEDFFSLLRLMLCEGTLGDIPAGIDEIIIGSADRMRFLSPSAVIVLGANEGVFPRPAASGGLFSPREERMLALSGFTLENLPEYKYAEERLIAFDALTCTKDKLILCYSDSSQTGESLMPSELIREAQRIFPGLTRMTAADFDKKERLCTPRAAFEEYAGIAGNHDVYSASLRQAVIREGEFAGNVASLDRALAGAPAAFGNKATAEELFGSDINFSASQIEAYHKCPFLYFCRYGMRVGRPVSAKLDQRIIGLLVHKVLEDMFAAYTNSEIRDKEPEELRRIIAGFVKAYTEEYMGGEASLPQALRRDIARSEEELYGIMQRFIREFDSCSFTTCRVELKIGGREEDIPAYTLRLPDGGSITVTGSIDRVDMMPLRDKTYVRIIDYKTGGKTFRLSDVFDGLNMQMLIYLFALCRNGKRLFGDLSPAGILYVPAKDAGRPLTDRHASAAAVESEKLKNGRMNGLILEDPEVLRGMESDAGGIYINASIKKDGSLSGAFLSLGEFSVLNDVIDDMLVGTGMELHEGRIPALPADTGDDRCRYCDYASVCLHEKDGAARPLHGLAHEAAREYLNGIRDPENKGS